MTGIGMVEAVPTASDINAARPACCCCSWTAARQPGSAGSATRDRSAIGAGQTGQTAGSRHTQRGRRQFRRASSICRSRTTGKSARVSAAGSTGRSARVSSAPSAGQRTTGRSARVSAAGCTGIAGLARIPATSSFAGTGVRAPRSARPGRVAARDTVGTSLPPSMTGSGDQAGLGTGRRRVGSGRWLSGFGDGGHLGGQRLDLYRADRHLQPSRAH